MIALLMLLVLVLLLLLLLLPPCLLYLVSCPATTPVNLTTRHIDPLQESYPPLS